jgi:hypothetical protein
MCGYENMTDRVNGRDKICQEIKYWRAISSESKIMTNGSVKE